MRTPLFLTAATLFLAALLPPVGAHHPCCAPCPTYTSLGPTGFGAATTQVGVTPSLQIYVSAVKGNYYIVNDAVASGDWISSFWIYQEYNGAGGLQRHDDYCYTEGYNSTRLADLNIW